MIKTCPVCKIEFETKRKDKACCSNACKLKRFRQGEPVDTLPETFQEPEQVETFHIPVVLGQGPMHVSGIFVDSKQVYPAPCSLCAEREAALADYREQIAELKAELVVFKSEPTSRADARRRSALNQLPEGEWEPL